MSARRQISGFIVAAPASGSGKTLLTLSLLRAFRAHGNTVGSFKVGPDYIDPEFHRSASGRPCYNLDPWGMGAATLSVNLMRACSDADLVIGEGVMGLFDGAADGSGSTADLAEHLGMPIVLVVDASGQSASAAALVHGFADFRSSLSLAGVIFNRIGGERHSDMLRTAMADQATPVLGCVPRHDDFTLPDRHLGLVQAAEYPDLERFLDRAAARLEQHVDLNRLAALAPGSALPKRSAVKTSIRPPGQRVAVAQDVAFAFAYPHLLDDWRDQGAEIRLFSPLADEAPPTADALYLPGGYPELHAGTLASNTRFQDGVRQMAHDNLPIYGECGGYMVLGEGLIDADGQRHDMIGLLPLETSFSARRLHLGYREAVLLDDIAFASAADRFSGHEFHYATTLREDGDDCLFECRDSAGEPVGRLGRRVGSVAGSFLHLIDRRD